MNRRLAAAVVIGLLGFLAVLTTAGSIGIAWDEAIYMRTARRYVSWTGLLWQNPAVALSRDAITENWGAQAAGPGAAGAIGDAHPPLVKIAGGLFWRALHGQIGDLLAFRLFPALVFGVLLAVLFLWVSEIAGALAGLAAVLCLALMPR